MARPRKLWSQKVGGYGHTVTVCERQPGGPIYLRWWDATRPGKNGGNFAWKSLGHTDKTRATEQAKELAAQLLGALEAARKGRLTLVDLLARYERDVSAHKKGAQPAEDRRRIALWTKYLGPLRDARTIDFPTLDRFVRDRKAGRITVEGHELAAKVGERAIDADLVFLNSALNYGTRVMTPEGNRLLSENPMRGYARPRPKNVKRPVATYDRYLKVRAKADDADPQRLFASFLDLVESLGWRVSAICQLRASDVDRSANDLAPFGRIRKRGETDKEGVEMWVPLAREAREALDRIQTQNPVIGDRYLFPAPKDARKPWTRWHARDLLERAEKAADVGHLSGGDFHPYRRAWATERKHLPAVDVAAAGGWRDLRSLERCYTHADPRTILDVVTSPTKLRDATLGA